MTGRFQTHRYIPTQRLNLSLELVKPSSRVGDGHSFFIISTNSVILQATARLQNGSDAFPQYIMRHLPVSCLK